MNITPEQIPDEVVEAALAAFNEFPCPKPGSITRCSNDDQMKSALAAALPVLLGEPVAWGVQFVWEGMGKSEIRMLALYRDEAEGVAYLEQQKISPGIPVSVNAIPLYTLPAPETPNAHP